VTPAPISRHQDAIALLFELVAPYLRREGVGYAFFSPADIIFSPRRLVQPDLFVVPLVNGRKPARWSVIRHLMLAVEVISPSTGRADRVRKRTLYREERVDEYWIVDAEARVVERSTPDEARPEILDSTLVWHPVGAREPLRIDLLRYFDELFDVGE
jgi:Uma2 family endonuclease